jgi:hypothetical protein
VVAFTSFFNNTTGTVSSGGGDAPASGTVENWTITSPTGFPSSLTSGKGEFHIADVALPSEKILVTAISGGSWTVTRGVEGSTPVVHAADFTIEQIVTAADFSGFQQGSVFPSGDTTGVTDNVTIATAMASGEMVLQPGGQYYVTAPMTLVTNGYISGNDATISPGSSFSGTTGLLTLAGTVANTVVRDLTLQDSWTISGLTGVYYLGAGQSVPNNYLSHVVCREFDGPGFTIAASSDSASAHLDNCIAYGNLGDGFQLTIDQVVVNCEAGFNEGHGFHCMSGSSNVYLSNCLAWFNGVDPQNNTWTSSGTSCGYFIDNSGQYIQLGNCHAQQNGLHGYAVGATSGGSGYAFECALTGCGADTNGAYGSVTAHGVFLSGAYGCVITGTTGYNNSDLSPGSQQWGIYMDGACTDTVVIGNTIVGSAGGVVNYTAATGYWGVGSLGLVATTGAGGYALTNGTAAILSWTAPNDGLMHRAQVFASLHVTATETGGAVSTITTLPDSTANTVRVFTTNQTSGVYYPISQTCPTEFLIKANSTISFNQTTALSGGTAVTFAELWAW